MFKNKENQLLLLYKTKNIRASQTNGGQKKR